MLIMIFMVFNFEKIFCKMNYKRNVSLLNQNFNVGSKQIEAK